ncbi:MAG: hypothetical protein EOP06_27155, partial [Proteobacteria bacterium]
MLLYCYHFRWGKTKFIFFWTLSAYFLVRFINSNKTRYIFFLAVSLALGWYSKYSVLFFIAALL